MNVGNWRTRAAWTFCWLALAGCEGYVTSPAASPRGPRVAVDDASRPPGDAAPSDAARPPIGSPPVCDGTLDVGPTALARLTRREIANAVVDGLGASGPVGQLPLDGTEEVHGYVHNRPEIDAIAARGYLSFAEAVATTAPIDDLTACRADDCAGRFIDEIGSRLARRPMFSDERERYAALYGARRELGLDVRGGMRLVLEAMLQSPSFLVRGEEAIASVAGEIVPLDDYEIASRLASFIWLSIPDAPLLEAAARGDLRTPAGIEAQAVRMLADPRADRMLRDFHLQWLGVRNAEGDITPSTDDHALIRSMRSEGEQFFIRVAREGRFEDLFTARHSYIDARLAAEIYRLAPPVADGLVRMELPEDRAGALTLPIFLAAKIREGTFSPIRIGVGTIRRFLCQELGNPPEGALEMNATFSGTPREISAQRNALFCSECHRRIDPIGFLFSGFDHLGRSVDGVDASATVTGSGRLDGPYDNIAAFSRTMAADPAVQSCYLGHFFTYAFGRAPTEADRCSVASIHERFERSDHQIDEIILGIVTSDSFRHRRATTTCE